MKITKRHVTIGMTGVAIVAASYAIRFAAAPVFHWTSPQPSSASSARPSPFAPPPREPEPKAPVPDQAPAVPVVPVTAAPASVTPVATPAPSPMAPPAAAPLTTPAAVPAGTAQPSAVPPPAPAPAAAANAQQTGSPQPENLLVQPQQASALSGIWVGNAAIPGRGMCRLRFEFHDDHQGQNHYQGFFQLWCSAVNIDRIDPEAATFGGTTDEGGITFKAVTLIGTDSHGCAPTGFNIIPFGAGQIVGKWSEAHCPGGHMIMQRGR